MAEDVTKSWGHQRMKEEADRTMADMNDLLDGPAIREEGWGTIHAIANHSKKPKEEVAKLIQEMPIGRIFSEDLVTRTIFVKTPDNKLQQVQDYVTRLEKSLIKFMDNESKYKKDFQALRERYDSLYCDTTLGQVSEFFRRIKSGFLNLLKVLGFTE